MTARVSLKLSKRLQTGRKNGRIEVVRLDPDVRIETGEQMPRHWQFMVIGPEKSRAYAFQWFAMAAVLLGFYIYFSTDIRSDRHE